MITHKKKKKKSPGLANFGTQVRSAQNRYAAVQTDLKYPLSKVQIKFI